MMTPFWKLGEGAREMASGARRAKAPAVFDVVEVGASSLAWSLAGAMREGLARHLCFGSIGTAQKSHWPSGNAPPSVSVRHCFGSIMLAPGDSSHE